MTPEQEALVEALRVASPTDEYNQPPLSLLRYIPSVRAVILALAAERDLWRLRCEWREAILARRLAWDDWSGAVRLATGREDELGRILDAASYTLEAARAAYVAAGGTP